MRYLLLIPVVIYVGASLWANYDLFPKDFMQYWWFDDLGHIIVFGSLTLVALTVAYRRQTSALFAITSVGLLAIVDEFSQLLLTYRSFSYQDLQMSLVGVTLAYVAYGLFLIFLRK
jgi:VanZ family protein